MSTPGQRAQKLLDETRGVRGQSGLHSRDVDFLESIVEQNRTTLSEKQEKWLADLERRVFDDGE